MKLVRRQAAGRQRCDERARTRDSFDTLPRRHRRTHDALAGVADARCARIRDERDLLAALQPFNYLLGALGLVELEVAEERLADFKMFQQLPRAARVLRRHHVALPQHAQGAQRDVLQVADGRGNQIERAGNQRRRRLVHAGSVPARGGRENRFFRPDAARCSHSSSPLEHGVNDHRLHQHVSHEGEERKQLIHHFP